MFRYTGDESEGLQAIPNHNFPEVLDTPICPTYTVQHNPVPPEREEHVEKSYHAQKTGNDEPEKVDGTIFGRRKATLLWAFLFLLSTIAAIVVGAVLGSRKSSSSCPPPTATSANQTSLAFSTSPLSLPSSSTSSLPSSTTSSTTSTTTSFSAPTDIILPLDCPTINTSIINKNYIPTGTFFKYQITCGQDCGGHDLIAIWAYSLDVCVDACVSFTHYNYTGMSCGAVAFRADLGNVTNLGGNCFLKQGACVALKQDAMVAHAVLLSLPFS